MAADPNNLIWIDMEMTGLQPDSDRIIEVALIVTDGQLAVLAESPVWVLHQPGEVLDAMDSWNKGTHSKSGLIEKVRASELTEAKVEADAIHVPGRAVAAETSPIGGNSVRPDRALLPPRLPPRQRFFHYTHLHAPTLEEPGR